jgi:hypothetical protein
MAMFEPVKPLHSVAARARWLVLLGSLSCVSLGAQAAASCMFRGADADARVINRSGEISTPYPMALSSNDCSRLRVANGTVTVYGTGSEGAQVSSRQVSRGPLLPASDAPAAAGTDTGAILKQIVVVLEGVSRTKTGSSRGAEGDYLVASLPTGKLAEPSTDLVLTLGPAPDANLASFELLVGGKPVYRQNGAAQTIKLPQAFLKAGTPVRWKLDYAGAKYEGQFTVEPAATLAALKQSLQKETPAGGDALVTKLSLAADLGQAGYAWDARELIRAALTP